MCCVFKERTLESAILDYRLRTLNLFRALIPRDQDCLLRCIAAVLRGDQSTHGEMRQDMIKHMLAQWDDTPLLHRAATKDDYLQYLEDKTMFGEEEEVQALCQVFQIHLKIFSCDLDSPLECVNHGDPANQEVSVVYLNDGMLDYGHFDLVLADQMEVGAVQVEYKKWKSIFTNNVDQKEMTYVFSDSGKLLFLTTAKDVCIWFSDI